MPLLLFELFICWMLQGAFALNHFLVTRTASSLVLNRRRTVETTLLPVTTKCVLNPIKISTMRKTKTNKVDTYIIAKTLMLQESFRLVTFYDLDPMDHKRLGRFRQKTIKQHTRLKIQMTSYIDQVFPELQYFFKSGLTKNLSMPY